MATQPISKKPLFNLNLVVQETGIKADTLRAWERRYQLPSPSRTDGGHRIFSSYDIETVKWLLGRQEEGMRISQAVDYWRELIAAGIDPLEEQPPGPAIVNAPSQGDVALQPLNDLVSQWIDHALAFDEGCAEQILDTAFRHYPWEAVCTNLIQVGLVEVGELWYSGEITVQQEHFASELVIKKLQSLIGVAPESYHPQKVLIGCPPGEYHTVAPLMMNLLLRYRGWEVSYLGANVPLDHLEDTLKGIRPELAVMTAARLSTSASLLDVSLLLGKYDLPLAFGGSAFRQNPQLVDRIPGFYLGEDLGQAVDKVEQLLSDPNRPAPGAPEPSPHQELANEIGAKLPQLENAVLIALADRPGSRFPLDTLTDANRYLLQDLLAALKLGDIAYLGPNLAWVSDLLSFREDNGGLIEIYRESFLTAAREILSDQAVPVLNQLAAIWSAADHQKEAH